PIPACCPYTSQSIATRRHDIQLFAKTGITSAPVVLVGRSHRDNLRQARRKHDRTTVIIACGGDDNYPLVMSVLDRVLHRVVTRTRPDTQVNDVGGAAARVGRPSDTIGQV